MFTPPRIILLSASAIVAAPVLAQTSVQLRYQPQADSDCYSQRVATTTVSTKDGPDGPGMVVEKDERFLAFHQSVEKLDQTGQTVSERHELRHLRIEVDRPNWKIIPYDSNSPKLNADQRTRELDELVSVGPSFKLVNEFDADLRELEDTNELLPHIHRYFGQWVDTPRGLEAVRYALIDTNVLRSFGAGLDLLSGASQQVGDTWATSRSLPLPYIGRGTLTWSCRLEELDGTLAIISATPSFQLDAAVPQSAALTMELGEVTGSALLRYDTELSRIVYYESKLIIPLEISETGPRGGMNRYDKQITLDLMTEEITQSEIPRPPRPGGWDWINRP